MKTIIEENEVITHVRNMTFDQIKDALWVQGYSGINDISEDEAFDKLVSFYQEYLLEFELSK